MIIDLHRRRSAATLRDALGCAVAQLCRADFSPPGRLKPTLHQSQITNHESRTVKSALREAAVTLRAASDSPDLDAGLLLAHVLGKPRSYLFGHPEAAIGGEEEARFRALVARRCGGEPVAYLTGHKGFRSLELTVGPAVLVPRPETELLVELALARIPADADWPVADLGTGSGAVALALARERPSLRITATDVDPAALAVAERNAGGLFDLTTSPVGAQLRCANRPIVFRRGDWFEALRGERFHLLVSNPPYVAEGDPHLAALGHEPRTALVAGEEGLDALRRIAAGAAGHLLPDGYLLLEHGADQGAAVRGLLTDAGFGAVETYRDLAGHERVTMGRC